VDLFLLLSAYNHNFHQVFQFQSFSDPAVAGEKLLLSGIEVIVEHNQYERPLYFFDDEVSEVVKLSIPQKRYSRVWRKDVFNFRDLFRKHHVPDTFDSFRKHELSE